MPAGRSCDLDAGLRLLVLRIGELEPPFAAREERRGDLVEVALHGVERLGEAALDRLGQLGAELLELGEARLEILALCRELVEARALAVVLLLRERVHLAERLAAALEPLRALGELVAVVALGALLRTRVLEPAARLVGLGLDARDLDVDRGHGLRRARQRLAQLDLGGAEAAQLVAELARACTAGVDMRTQRCLEACGRLRGGRERRVEALRAGEHTRELMRTRAPPARADRGVDASSLGRPRALAELRGLGRGGVVRGDERARLVAVAVRLGGRERAAEPREVALCGRRSFDGSSELAAQRALGIAELAQRGAERSRAARAGFAACAQRRLDDVDRMVERLERALEARGRGEQSLERGRRGAADAKPRRGSGERRLRLLGLLVGARGGTLREPCLFGERLCLVGERGTARLELEQHRLGGLAREPELAALRVVAVALARDGRNLRLEQLVLRHDGQLVDELARIASREDAQRAEAGRCGPLEQLERRLRRRRDERGRTCTERRRDRALAARLDRQQRESEALPLLGERAGCGRNAFALGECALERGEALLRGERALGERVALVRRLASRGARVQRPLLELLGRRATARRLGLGVGELGAEPRDQPARRLALHGEARRAAAQLIGHRKS